MMASFNTRKRREIKSGRQDGRGKEIERIIGRSLRTAIDFSALGEYTITLDCDVIDADFGLEVLKSFVFNSSTVIGIFCL